MLQIKNLMVFFENALAINDLTLEVAEGEFVGVIGSNSAGKTTLMRLVAGLLLPEGKPRRLYGEAALIRSLGELVAEDGGNLSRCPDKPSAARMEALVREVLEAKDSVGGVVSCVCRNLPAGWGEPVFDKLDAMLAQAMLSLPATKGFEIGSGFAGTRLRGSQHNDPFVQKGKRLGTLTNYAGGTLGGISSGEPVLFRVAFKPVATIGQSQQTVDFDGKPVILEAKGRHDPCVVPRAVPIVESMAALVLLDLALRQKVRGA